MPDDPGLPDPVPAGTPRWVKVFGAVLLVLLALAVGVAVLSGGEHGPGRHLSSGGGSSAPSGPTAAAGSER